MIPVLTAEQSRRQDALATSDPRTLLDRAGLAVALQAVALGAGYGSRVAVLAGPGNNGGDGYVAARYLAGRGIAVDVYPLAEPRTDPARWARDLARREGVRIRRWSDARPADMVIDALFGAGFRGEPPDLSSRDQPGPGGEAGVPWLAVDVPSGLDATTGEAAAGTPHAQATVTFHGYRVGHLIASGPDRCGDVVVADIGLPDVAPELRLCEEADAPLPVRPRTAHKWSAGSVLVVGGSDGLDGAATLTARSALRAGAGAVMIACPPTVEEKVRAPEIMTRAIGSGRSLSAADLPQVVELAQRFDLVIIGPGLGSSPDLGPFVTGILRGWQGPVVADADALNALGDPGGLARSGDTVITPHAGEFQRLTGRAATYQEAARLAGDTGATVLLKGAPTFVMGADRWLVNSGGRELATIGTGDVLAGMIGAFWAAGGGDGAEAARSGAYWHGRAAAELAARRTVTADLLVEQVAITTQR
ncbi:MAG: NAD(P)H-hydrate dehydratase [Acidimicrobiia bacterium]|nr:NAD(P)H-hydrate dehydratase [Acidimicrobiia bacterium]MYC85779.1 NAD(P)H-hydrate dehydratase [Acidimicrobiia bacterium]